MHFIHKFFVFLGFLLSVLLTWNLIVDDFIEDSSMALLVDLDQEDMLNNKVVWYSILGLWIIMFAKNMDKN